MINMKRKFRILGKIGLALFLVSALMLAVVPAVPVSAATAVEDVWVEFPYSNNSNISDDTSGDNIYLVHFKATTALTRGVDTVTVTFPDGTATMGGTAGSGYAFTVGTLEYNDVQWSTNYDTAAVTTATWTYSRGAPTTGGYRVKAKAPMDIAAGTDVWLKFDVDADAELESGSTAGAYFKVYVATSQDTTMVLSSAFTLDATDEVTSSIETTLSPGTAGAATQYVLDFTCANALTAATGTVTVKFPVGTVLPSSIAAANIEFSTDDGSTYTACGTAPTVDTNKRIVTATTSVDLGADDLNRIKFLSAAGITNPTTASAANDYFCMIRTSEDGEWAIAGADHDITAGAATTLVAANGEIGLASKRYSDDATMINFYSSMIYVTTVDANGNAKDPGTITVTLATSSATGVFYTSTSHGTGAFTSKTSITVSVADPYCNNQEVFYKDSTAGTHTLTFAHANYTDATWTITVCPAVSLYDSNDALVGTYGPTTTSVASETGGTADETNTDTGDYINDAITAAMSGDTVKLGDGTYEVDSSGIVVNEAITLESINGADSTTIRVTVDYDAIVCTSRATISGLYIKGWRIGETQGIGASGESGIECSASGTWANPAVIQNCKIEGFYNGIESSPSKEYWEVTNNEFTNCRTGLCFNSAVQTTISGNTFTNYYSGIGGTENAATYTIKNNSFNGNNSSAINGIKNLAAQYGCTGIGVAVSVATLVITRNTFTGNDYGIQVYSDSDNTLIKYNDITGNASFGIYSYGGGSYDADARYNWWGDATGPSVGTGAYASSTAVGSGDAICTSFGSAKYEPWLHKTKADVIADNASYQAGNIKLVAGWNTLSTPVKLIEAADAIDELISADDMTIGYYYDATTGWQQIETGYTLSPCDAVYVKMSPETTYVYFKFDAGAFTMPNKDLAAGWNLISLAYLEYSNTGTFTTQMNVDEAVTSIALSAGGLPGYSQVIAPSMNAGQTDIYGIAGVSWAFSYGETVSDSTATQKMLAGLGYWVYMQNAATLAGFIITPIVPDFD